MALSSMHQYLLAKHMRRKGRLYQNLLIPVDNVLHSVWSGCDVTMNGELVSTMNQKYMYKSYFETVLNNSHSTKKYQLKTSGYFGYSGNKDVNFMQIGIREWKNVMSHSVMKIKLNLWDF